MIHTISEYSGGVRYIGGRLRFYNGVLSMRKLLYVLICAFCLTGCADRGSPSSGDGASISDASQGTAVSAQDGIVTLCYGCDEFSCMDQETVEEVNQYLQRQGCTYRVECVNLYSPDQNASTSGYAQAVKDYVDGGNSLDLCYLSVMFDGSWLTSYDILRQDGYLECLNTYLEGDEELASSMPELKWASLRIDGDIYGLNGYAYSTQPGVTYVVSKEMMNKYGLGEEDLNKPLSELKELLVRIQQEEEKTNAQFVSLNYTLNTADYCYFSRLYPVDGYLSGICLDENEPEAPLIYTLDDEEYIQLLREMFQLYSEEQIKVTTDYQIYYENSFLNVIVEGLFPGQNITSMGYYESVDENRVIEADEVVLLYPYDTGLRINDYIAANAILSQSEHKEEAFDFLRRMFVDEELSNLLQYGAGYTIYDGHAYAVNAGQLEAVGLTASWIRGNGFIGAACYYESENQRAEYFDIYSQYGYVSPWSGFKFDRTDYEKEIAATNQVMAKLSDLFSGSVSDFDRYISDLRAEFMEAGGERLYAAVKQQFEDYLSHKTVDKDE